ncbi:unnamed protein product [Adineta steineri]|uniref:Ion transport domain-containing protein n=1 Tax=Adineta steineri TaxID=433720 RepID=A0A815CRV7_9BILA|nr:unnamed protein product [Adineta steineri]CAF3708462.1 unnamed protein product [Adineta steineri]
MKTISTLIQMTPIAPFNSNEDNVHIINPRAGNRSRKSDLFDELIGIIRTPETNASDWPKFEKKLNEYLNDRYSHFAYINIRTFDYDTILILVAQAESIWKSSTENSDSPSTNERKIPEFVEYLLTKVYRGNMKAIDARDDENRTALHHAILHGRWDYMKRLIKLKADVEVKTMLKATVLHFICRRAKDDSECCEMLTFLFEERKCLDSKFLLQKNTEGLTAEKDTYKYLLHFAAKFNNNRKVSVEANNSENNRELDKISHKINTKYCKDAWERISAEGYTPLNIAAHYGNNGFIKYAIENVKNWREYICQPTQNSRKMNVLHICVEQSESTSSPVENEKGKTTIMYRHSKYLEIFNTILKRDSMCFKTLLQAGDSDKNTPLHTAARMKNQEIFEYLLKRGRELKISSSKGKEENNIYGVTEPRNWLGQTPLFECAEYNRKSFMEKLLSEQPNSIKWTKILDQLKDQNQRTCLHIACYNGSLDIVKYLITVHQISINPYASARQTPLYEACEGGFVDVVRYLLDYTDANPTIRTAKGYNCLDIAIARHHHEIVKRLLEYPEWRTLMESVQYEDSDVPITPMRRLIISMPEIAYELIDKHFTTIIGDADQPKHLIKYDYTFIDDHYNICDWQFDDNVDKPGSKLSKWYKSILTKVNVPDRRHPYTPFAYTLLRNHPLMLMSQCSQEKLITHPLCLALRKAKFRRFSRWILLLSFLSYIMFMALYTIVVLQTIHPQHYYDLYNSSGNASGQNIEWDYGFNSDVCRRVGIYLIESGNTDARKTANQERYLLMLDVLLIIFVIKNGIFILASFPRFIRKIAYYTEALALVLVYVCIRDDNSWQKSLNFRCPIQWELGSIGLLLSWLVFLSYMRYIPWMDIGLYVVMLNVILLKFLRAIPLLMVLFCGFGFTYYMLLQYQTVYGTPFEAMFRTALSLFDLGYESRLYNPPTGVMYYPVVYFVFILTQIILTILMTNMLIGLALGEIPTLKTQATLLRNKMMYELFFDYEIFHLQLKTIVRIILYFLMCRVCRRRSNSSIQPHRIRPSFSLFETHVNDEIIDDQSSDTASLVKKYFKWFRDTITEDDIQSLIMVERNYQYYHKEMHTAKDQAN